jgi:YggT family protein
MLALAALTRDDIASYVNDLFDVYLILLLIYILTNMLFSFGMRPPYSRALDAVLTFLREVSEPLLRVFRRFVPTIGMFDLSPLLAIVVLLVLQRLLVDLIQG